MRSSFLLASISLAALTLASCNNTAANDKPMKAAVLNGRQEVVLRLAHATEAAGDYLGAEKLYLQVVSQNPDNPMSHVELAEFYRRHHEDQKAIAGLKDAIRLQPNDTDVARELANTYINAGEPEKALVVLDTAIAANSRNPLLYNSKGVALDQIGNYHDAQKAYAEAFNLDPADSTTFKINLSMSYILEGSYDKAVALLRPMLNAPDAPPIARQNLALAYGLKGESEDALKLGLQDLSTSEAEENVKFYRMLARKHQGYNPDAEKPVSSNTPVPASVIKELFPDEEPIGPVKDIVEVPELPKPPQTEATVPAVPTAPAVSVITDENQIPPMPPLPPIMTAPAGPAANPVMTQEMIVPAPPEKKEAAVSHSGKSTADQDDDEDDDKEEASAPAAIPVIVKPAPVPPQKIEEFSSRTVAPQSMEKENDEDNEDETAAPTQPPKKEELSSRAIRPANVDKDDEEDDEEGKAPPAPQARNTGRMPIQTIEELSPSSGGNAAGGSVIIVTPDETQLPEPVLKPDRY